MTTTVSAAPATRTLAAFTPAQAQRTYRAALEAMARPGDVQHLPDVEALEGRPAAAALLLALADLMSPVAGLDDADAALTAEVARITGAPLVPLAQARMVLSTRPPAPRRLLELPPGSAWLPEHGALLAQQVTALGERATDGPCLLLSGPGVDGVRELRVDGLTAEALADRDERCRDFPAGVDLVLVAPDGAVAALPRTTRIEVTS
ncbi:phosphonate C-P lyase system protein PhnH [Georgenia alba]|uniref:Phosphonate C-P lyase system protein PhnH n=1 Tax=Georgenia alba TaxID=2233858 RepID=A0ABW2Q7Y6_9MICO